MIKKLMSYQVFIFAFSGIRRTHVNISWMYDVIPFAAEAGKTVEIIGTKKLGIDLRRQIPIKNFGK